LNHHGLFSDKSELYASARPTYPPEMYRYLSSACPATQRAWDCACGNGQAASGLIREFDQVYATDVSDQQIVNARQHPGITYSVSPSEKTSFDDDAFDLVCVAQALHWFDFDAFWPEVKRVLKPGGVFAAWGYTWLRVDREIDAIIEQGILETIKPYWAPQNKLIWDHYRDVHIPFTPMDPPSMKMEFEWNLNQLFNYLHTYSATRRCMDASGDAFFRDAYAKAGFAWGDPSSTKKMGIDFVFYVGRHEG
jgi:ubiquinone/menaquinone biosynthesis C-methylase UbiE